MLGGPKHSQSLLPTTPLKNQDSELLTNVNSNMHVASSIKSTYRDIADGVSYATKSPLHDFYQNDSMWPQVLNERQQYNQRNHVSNFFSPRNDEYLLSTLNVDFSKNRRKINRINAIYNY